MKYGTVLSSIVIIAFDAFCFILVSVMPGFGVTVMILYSVIMIIGMIATLWARLESKPTSVARNEKHAVSYVRRIEAWVFLTTVLIMDISTIGESIFCLPSFFRLGCQETGPKVSMLVMNIVKIIYLGVQTENLHWLMTKLSAGHGGLSRKGHLVNVAVNVALLIHNLISDYRSVFQGGHDEVLPLCLSAEGHDSNDVITARQCFNGTYVTTLRTTAEGLLRPMTSEYFLLISSILINQLLAMKKSHRRERDHADEDGGDATENLHGDNGGDTTENLHDDNGGDATENLRGDDAGDATQNLHSDDGGDATENLHGDDDTENLHGYDATENLHGDNGGDATENLHDDNDGDATENLHGDDDGDDTENLHGDDATENLHGDDGGDATENLHGDDSGDATESLHGDDGGMDGDTTENGDDGSIDADMENPPGDDESTGDETENLNGDDAGIIPGTDDEVRIDVDPLTRSHAQASTPRQRDHVTAEHSSSNHAFGKTGGFFISLIVGIVSVSLGLAKKNDEWIIPFSYDVVNTCIFFYVGYKVIVHNKIASKINARVLGNGHYSRLNYESLLFAISSFGVFVLNVAKALPYIATMFSTNERIEILGNMTNTPYTDSVLLDVHFSLIVLEFTSGLVLLVAVIRCIDLIENDMETCFIYRHSVSRQTYRLNLYRMIFASLAIWSYTSFVAVNRAQLHGIFINYYSERVWLHMAHVLNALAAFSYFHVAMKITEYAINCKRYDRGQGNLQ